ARIAETAPLFASLLSIPTGERYVPLALSAAQQRRLTLAALLDQLEALAWQKPVLMLFEDAHWADATSLEVLDLTVERVRALPVLVLITFRPEYEAPWDRPLARHQRRARPPGTCRGRDPGRACRRPTAAARSNGADRHEDRRGAALCRGTDQGGAGIGP